MPTPWGRGAVGDVPDGYVVHRVGTTWLVLDAKHAAALVELRLADPKVREQIFQRGNQRGRGIAPRVTVTRDVDAILRRYTHGGMLGALLGSLYWGPGRALRELKVTAQARIHGAPVPHVLCLVMMPVAGPFWSAMIGTEEERHAQDLDQALANSSSIRQRRALLRRVGTATRRLHDAGVEHRDLQVRNILITPEPDSRIVVIDLDRAKFHRHAILSGAKRADNLGRLVRSAIKRGHWPHRFGVRELAVLISGYLRGNRQLRAELRPWLKVERLKLWPHRMRYRFMRPAPQSATTPPPRQA